MKKRTKSTMLRLPSNPRNVRQVEAFVKKLVEKHRLSPDAYGDILISVTEAVNNAIIHGNRKDESKTVKIHLSKNNGHLAIRVSDEGRGFDYSKLADPTSPENRSKLGGRGVFLMKQLADRIRFHDNGRTVEMQFRLR